MVFMFKTGSKSEFPFLDIIYRFYYESGLLEIVGTHSMCFTLDLYRIIFIYVPYLKKKIGNSLVLWAIIDQMIAHNSLFITVSVNYAHLFINHNKNNPKF